MKELKDEWMPRKVLFADGTEPGPLARHGSGAQRDLELDVLLEGDHGAT
jgi:hypothetical protein